MGEWARRGRGSGPRWGSNAGMLGKREAELRAQEDAWQRKKAEHPCSENPWKAFKAQAEEGSQE